MKRLIDSIEENQLPEPYSDLVHIIGLESVIELAKLFGGSRVYFPKIDKITRPHRDEKIVAEYNGYNARELARRYSLTENRILQICRHKELK